MNFAQRRGTKMMSLAICRHDLPTTAVLNSFCDWLAAPACQIQDFRLLFSKPDSLDRMLNFLRIPENAMARLDHVHLEWEESVCFGELPDLSLLDDLVLFEKASKHSFVGFNLDVNTVRGFADFLGGFMWHEAKVVRVSNCFFEHNECRFEPRVNAGEHVEDRLSNASPGAHEVSCMNCGRALKKQHNPHQNVRLFLPWTSDDEDIFPSHWRLPASWPVFNDHPQEVGNFMRKISRDINCEIVEATAELDHRVDTETIIWNVEDEIQSLRCRFLLEFCVVGGGFNW